MKPTGSKLTLRHDKEELTMATNESKWELNELCDPLDWDLGATSDSPDSLRRDNGSLHQKVRGVGRYHLDERQYIKPGRTSGMPNPSSNKDASASVMHDVFGRDHLDDGQVRPDYTSEMKYNANQPDKRGPGASVARARRSSAHEYLDPNDEGSWYGAPDGKRQE
jgi:hypothetical protein